jgi:exosortase N
MPKIKLMICSAYILVAILLSKDYMLWNATSVFGLLMIPLVYRFEKGRLSIRLIVPTLIFVALAIFVPTRSTLFFALVLAFLLLIESFKGKISPSIFFMLALISPLFKTFCDTISFPLRLWMSNMVSDTLVLIGMEASSSGNIIVVDGFDFYIDQACAGLSMLNISLLLAIFIISARLKVTGRELPLWGYFGFLLTAVLLNILSNYFRILGIVIFKIMPDTILHDGVGIVVLIIYVLVPLILITPHYTERFGRLLTIKHEPTDFKAPLAALQYIHIALFFAIMYVTYAYGTNAPVHPNKDSITLNGFRKIMLPNQVLKFENKTALIYMKPCQFYSPEHNPMVCWTGSGYEFTFIKKVKYNGIEIYTGTLLKGKEKLYTSWWFDDGKTKTIDQWNWRWKGATGKRFYLMNVSSPTYAQLKRTTNELLPSPFAGNP